MQAAGMSSFLMADTRAPQELRVPFEPNRLPLAIWLKCHGLFTAERRYNAQSFQERPS